MDNFPTLSRVSKLPCVITDHNIHYKVQQASYCEAIVDVFRALGLGEV